MKFNVCVVELPAYVHSQAFAELADLLCFGLRDLGHAADTSVNHIAPDARNIVIGCHLVAVDDVIRSFPADTIVINTEPLHDAAGAWNDRIIGWARLFEIWDYNPATAARLAGLTGRPVRYLPLGYHPRLGRIAAAPVQDIDVLFYGSVNDRRRRVFAALATLGIAPKLLFGVYGAARDAVIARARIVLNVHAADGNGFEAVRVTYLMNNAKAVVTEADAGGVIDPRYAAGVRAVAYDDLAAACKALLDDEAARAALERGALACLTALPQAALLAPLLADPGAPQS
jgi:hypothetical protein